MSQPGSPLFTGEFNNGNELDWSVYSKTDSYEAVFGVDAHGNLDGDQLLTVLNQPAQSNASPINLEVPLAKQAVTALLNATNDADGAVTQDFRFSAADVISAVKEVYDDGHFDTLQGADLTGLLAFWNAAPCRQYRPRRPRRRRAALQRHHADRHVAFVQWRPGWLVRWQHLPGARDVAPGSRLAGLIVGQLAGG